MPVLAYGDVFIPENEFIGYFDSEGVYTVGGNVKNQNSHAVVPTITVSVIDGNDIITKTITHVPIPAGKDIPFKVKLPEVTGDLPILQKTELKFIVIEKDAIPVEIIYDKTLITHDDGHVTGRIQNTGNQTIFNPKVFAIVHGHGKVLDIVQNIEYFDRIEPGQILEFSMFPDPSINEPVRYYSCFAPVDSTVTPVTTRKNDGLYDFRYDSGGWYYDAKFNQAGTVMVIQGTNSYPWPTYVNFEFPPITGDEKFHVLVNDKPIKFIQSIDEMGNWHVAFDVASQSQSVVTISGFPVGLPQETSKIPTWIKQNAAWWSTDQITDPEFLEGIEFLISKGIIVIDSQTTSKSAYGTIPSWIKTVSEWWSNDKVSDEDFLATIKYLVEKGIITI